MAAATLERSTGAELASLSGVRNTIWYDAAIGAGATHDDVVAAHEVGIDTRVYARGRDAGISHDELLSASVFDRVEPYVDARVAGATADQIDEVIVARADLARYVFFLRAGAPHDAALDSSRRAR